MSFATIPAMIEESTPPEMKRPNGASHLTSSLTTSMSFYLSSA